MNIELLQRDEIAASSEFELEALVDDDGRTFYLFAPPALDELLYVGPVPVAEENWLVRGVPALFYLSIVVLVGLWLRPILSDINRMTNAAQHFAADYRTPLRVADQTTELTTLAQNLDDMSLRLSGSDALMDPLLVEQIEQGNLDALASLNQEALGQMALAFLVGISISGTLSYFAIPLIWFRQSSLGAALASGLRALLVNWQAFLLLGLGLFLLFLPVAFAVGLLFGIVAGGGLAALLVTGLIMILLLAFQLMLFGTQYCAFRDVFGTGQQGAPPVEPEGQLLA